MSEGNPDEITRDVGYRIAELRETRGWTQDQAATEAKVSLKYLQRVEGGGVNLTIHSLVKFANVLGVPTLELFTKPTRERRSPGRPPRSGK